MEDDSFQSPGRLTSTAEVVNSSVNEKLKSCSSDSEYSDIHQGHLEQRWGVFKTLDRQSLITVDSCKPGISVAASGYEVVWWGSNWDKNSGKLTGPLLWPRGRLKFLLQCRFYYSKQNGVDRKNHLGPAVLQLVGWCDEQLLRCVNSSECEVRACFRLLPFRQAAKFPGNWLFWGPFFPWQRESFYM